LGALAEADAHKAEAEKFRAEAAAAKAEAAEAKAETERIRAAKPFVPADAYLPQEAAQLADLGKTLAECQSEKAFWARKAKEGDDFEVGGKEYTAADALEISMGYARREGECAARREAISEGASRRFALRAAALQARAAQGAAARGAPPASAPPAPAAPQAPGQDAPARVPKTAEEARAWAAGEDW
jgi:hypothetical protein